MPYLCRVFTCQLFGPGFRFWYVLVTGSCYQVPKYERIVPIKGFMCHQNNIAHIEGTRWFAPLFCTLALFNMIQRAVSTRGPEPRAEPEKYHVKTRMISLTFAVVNIKKIDQQCNLWSIVSACISNLTLFLQYSPGCIHSIVLSLMSLNRHLAADILILISKKPVSIWHLLKIVDGCEIKSC